VERAALSTGVGGACFVEMSFNLGFKALSGSLVAATLRIEDNDDLASGTIARSYNGSVTMQGDRCFSIRALSISPVPVLFTRQAFRRSLSLMARLR
jgi:hypothetical protein